MKFSDNEELTSLSFLLESSEENDLFSNPETSNLEDPRNLGSNKKGTNKAMIGAIAGVAAAVVIVAVVATVLIIRKRKKKINETDASVAENDNSQRTNENQLKLTNPTFTFLFFYN